MKTALILISLFAGLTEVARCEEEPAVIVTLRDAPVAIRGMRVRVADVADVEVLASENTARVLASRLKRLELARFQGASSLKIVQTSVRAVLIRAGIADRNLVVDGPATITVSQRRLRIDAGRTEGLMRKHLKEVLGSKASEVDLELAGIFRPAEVPVGKFRLDLNVTPATENPQYVGRMPMWLVAIADGETVLRHPFDVLLRREVEVVRVKRRVNKGRPLSSDDIELVNMVLDGRADGLLFSLSDALGRTTKVQVEKGTLLDSRSLKSLTVIRKGDLVTARVRIGKLTAAAMCRAESDAGIGDHVMLRNLESDQTVFGRVIDGRTVEVTAKR